MTGFLRSTDIPLINQILAALLQSYQGSDPSGNFDQAPSRESSATRFHYGRHAGRIGELICEHYDNLSGRHADGILLDSSSGD